MADDITDVERLYKVGVVALNFDKCHLVTQLAHIEKSSDALYTLEMLVNTLENHLNELVKSFELQETVKFITIDRK